MASKLSVAAYLAQESISNLFNQREETFKRWLLLDSSASASDVPGESSPVDTHEVGRVCWSPVRLCNATSS